MFGSYICMHAGESVPIQPCMSSEPCYMNECRQRGRDQYLFTLGKRIAILFLAMRKLKLCWLCVTNKQNKNLRCFSFPLTTVYRLQHGRSCAVTVVPGWLSTLADRDQTSKYDDHENVTQTEHVPTQILSILSKGVNFLSSLSAAMPDHFIVTRCSMMEIADLQAQNALCMWSIVSL